MAAKICKGGLYNYFNAKLTGATGPTPFTVRLFKNNHKPSVDDTVADYTEATFGGYAGQLLGTMGTITWDNTLKIWWVQWDPLTFAGDGTGGTDTIYGYYITGNDGSLLSAVKRDAGTISMGAAGSYYNVIPKLTEGKP